MEKNMEDEGEAEAKQGYIATSNCQDQDFVGLWGPARRSLLIRISPQP